MEEEVTTYLLGLPSRGKVDWALCESLFADSPQREWVGADVCCLVPGRASLQFSGTTVLIAIAPSEDMDRHYLLVVYQVG